MEKEENNMSCTAMLIEHSAVYDECREHYLNIQKTLQQLNKSHLPIHNNTRDLGLNLAALVQRYETLQAE